MFHQIQIYFLHNVYCRQSFSQKQNKAGRHKKIIKLPRLKFINKMQRWKLMAGEWNQK